MTLSNTARRKFAARSASTGAMFPSVDAFPDPLPQPHDLRQGADVIFLSLRQRQAGAKRTIAAAPRLVAMLVLAR